MSNGMTDLTSALNALADSINAKAGTSGAMTIPQMTNAVGNIPSGSEIPTITITASQVVSQEPIMIQLTEEQYEIWSSNAPIINWVWDIDGYRLRSGVAFIAYSDNGYVIDLGFELIVLSVDGVTVPRVISVAEIPVVRVDSTAGSNKVPVSDGQGDYTWTALPSSTGGHTLTIVAKNKNGSNLPIATISVIHSNGTMETVTLETDDSAQPEYTTIQNVVAFIFTENADITVPVGSVSGVIGASGTATALSRNILFTLYTDATCTIYVTQGGN